MDIQVHAMPVLQNMILVWISVIILYFILKHFLHKPIKNMLAKRQDYVEDQIQDADKKQEEAMALKKEYEEMIDNAKEEGAAIVETYRERGEGLEKKIINDANEEARQIMQRAQREADRQRDLAMEDIKSQAADMALMIANKVLVDGVNENEQRKLIDNFIDELGDEKWLN